MLRLPPPLAACYRLATDREVRSWSFGVVEALRDPAAQGWQHQRGTLDDQRIFGPLCDFECACGKYRGMKYKGMICDRCGVKVTSREARRQRFGHIELPQPVRHPQGEDGDRLSAIPVLPAGFLESSAGAALVAVYEDLVRAAADVAPDGPAGALQRLVELLLPVVVLAHQWGLSEAATFARGLALADRAAPTDGRCDQCGFPLEGLHIIACPRCGKRLRSM
jgi:hypothetical protein